MTHDHIIQTFTVGMVVTILLVIAAIFLYNLIATPVDILLGAALLVAFVVLMYVVGWLVEVVI